MLPQADSAMTATAVAAGTRMRTMTFARFCLSILAPMPWLRRARGSRCGQVH